MISFEQCKHVIHYYVIKMMSEDPLQVAPHIQRDCLFMNKMRGETCANICMNPKLKPILLLLHNASNIEQVNSIPKIINVLLIKRIYQNPIAAFN